MSQKIWRTAWLINWFCRRMLMCGNCFYTCQNTWRLIDWLWRHVPMYWKLTYCLHVTDRLMDLLIDFAGVCVCAGTVATRSRTHWDWFIDYEGMCGNCFYTFQSTLRLIDLLYRRMRMCGNCSYTCQNTWEMDYHARSKGHKAKVCF